MCGQIKKLNGARMSADGDGSTEPNLDSRKMYLKSRSSVIPSFLWAVFQVFGEGYRNPSESILRDLPRCAIVKYGITMPVSADVHNAPARYGAGENRILYMRRYSYGKGICNRK